MPGRLDSCFFVPALPLAAVDLSLDKVLAFALNPDWTACPA